MSTRSLPFLLLMLPLAACGGGGKAPSGSGGGGDPVVPPAPLSTTAPGVIGAAPLSTSARIEIALPQDGSEAALFGAEDKGQVFAGAPLLEGLTEDFAIVGGLAAGTDHYFGLGVRPGVPSPGDGGEAYVQTGAVVRVRTGAPIYVDALADPGTADGLTPATAFSDLLLGLLTAAAGGGGNVFVRGGAYPIGSVPMLDGVDVYGGFDATFELATRGAEPSLLTGGLSGQGMLVILGQGEPNIVDGISFDGGAFAAFGIDVSDADAELRSCVTEHFAGRGIRLRNAPGKATREVAVIGCTSRQNDAEGLSLAGAFRLRVEGSRFDSNGQEGLDCNDLIANDGDTAELYIRGSGFFGNGAQGLDADLAAPAVIGPFGGLFDVRVEGSTFELNGEEGLLLDQDHEGVPGWRASIVVRGVRTRANRLEGIRIDADAEATILVNRVASFGNGSDGLWVSSETAPGLAVVGASAFVGNQGAGLRASLGNKVVAASHCVFAFNAGGGFVSEFVESSVASSAFYQQPSPWTGVVAEAEVVISDALPSPFANAPEAHALALAESQGVMTLQVDVGAFVGMSVELADDDVPREVVAAGGTLLEVAPAPEVFLTPGSVLLFAADAPVVEDWSPAIGSPLEGAGMAPPGGAAVDAGPFGAGAGGAPGDFTPGEPSLFGVAATTPPSSAGIGATEDLAIAFAGGTLDPATLIPGSVRVLGQAGEVPVTLLIVGGEVLVSPPGAGWGTGPLLVQIHGVLASTDGRPLAASVAIPFATP